jgi:hypothetical protein
MDSMGMDEQLNADMPHNVNQRVIDSIHRNIQYNRRQL